MNHKKLVCLNVINLILNQKQKLFPIIKLKKNCFDSYSRVNTKFYPTEHYQCEGTIKFTLSDAKTHNQSIANFNVCSKKGKKIHDFWQHYMARSAVKSGNKWYLSSKCEKFCAALWGTFISDWQPHSGSSILKIRKGSRR